MIRSKETTAMQKTSAAILAVLALSAGAPAFAQSAPPPPAAPYASRVITLAEAKAVAAAAEAEARKNGWTMVIVVLESNGASGVLREDGRHAVRLQRGGAEEGPDLGQFPPPHLLFPGSGEVRDAELDLHRRHGGRGRRAAVGRRQDRWRRSASRAVPPPRTGSWLGPASRC
jgi:hypothetical protein